MNKFLSIFGLILLLSGCLNNSNPFKEINSKEIKTLSVYDVYTYDSEGTSYGSDTVKYESNNREVIEKLFSYYLQPSKKRMAKIFSRYFFSFEYEGKEYFIWAGKDCITYEGQTYLVDGDLEQFLEKELGIVRRIF